MKGTVLVIGGGIAGMRAAVELLLQRFKVYLLEEGTCIGGKTATIDQLFPPSEHAACAIQPLILELTSNPNATILTSSKVLSLHGGPGDFKVEVLTEQAGTKGDSQSTELTVGAVIVTKGPEIESAESLEQLGLEFNDKGYIKKDPHSNHPCRTSRSGVFMCGTAQKPKEIGELVVQACAAAAAAAALLAPVRGSELVTPTESTTLPISPTDEPKIAVVIDRGDVNLSEVLNLDEYTRTLPGVECVEITSYSDNGSKITELLGTGDFNRLVVAGPSPITHEYLFQRHAENTGLNRFLLEIVNLHNHCARVHSDNGAAATNKARILMKMGIARARLLEPIGQLRVTITQRCLVVGGSPAGVACAAKLAEMGLQVELVELTGDLTKVPGNDQQIVTPLLDRCRAQENIHVHTQTRVESVEGRMGNFKVNLVREGETTTVEVGAIVMAAVMDVENESEGAGLEEALALQRGEDGFYISTEGAMNLLDFDTAGAFNCGSARAMLTTEDALIDGEAAASRAACIIASNTMTRPPTISDVIDKNCDGCAYCVDTCPTRSITLLEFMLSGDIKKVVEVSERTCIGCGICMSTCPKKGIDVKHYRLEFFSEMVKTALENAGDEPVIVSFCCNRCAYPAADAAGSAGIQYPASIRIIRTVCSGMIHPNIIMDALTQGADGVLLCGCHPGNCRSREGIRKALDRKEAIELMLEDFGLEPERFRLEHIAASEGPKFAQVVRDMTDELSSLGPSPYRQNP
ncbi:MAG: hydrogenase iron-sulfur subunit [Phycisphaerae bacterium]|nr:hydrogenase iron-sulfur subunit [Phycisphaerae bacterium]NIP55399.1 hydrogenase iron-sulfur subunit [Phycisphaerae bacterium]NIS54069.1 hydrogenase iron-sulfur subunit [Phycisphaerae bacterium]NIU11712.1 hydrogenase iron-sulfur subunit [Phycisphaerae bacterium]NIU59527.1 hydrogenase iron-sulfur subunit [Phycisphaerae bacterium]